MVIDLFYSEGSFATATCQSCFYRVSADVIKEDIFAQRIPRCPLCTQTKKSHTENFPTINNDTSFTCKNKDSGTSQQSINNTKSSINIDGLPASGDCENNHSLNSPGEFESFLSQ